MFGFLQEGQGTFTTHQTIINITSMLSHVPSQSLSNTKLKPTNWTWVHPRLFLVLVLMMARKICDH
ncbi:hypothetical protein Fmac_019692 [Flemingia macrophylla]|uniref:Uncharacterized protein n=1 Tax=Flemingia macrophylla TaxID=520843 RepID=A0ABD1M8H6_9FABA